MNIDYKQMLFFRRGGYWFILAICLILFTFIVGFVITVLELSKDDTRSVYANPLNLVRRMFHLDSRLGRDFMEQVIPGMKSKTLEEDPDLFLEVDVIDLFLRFMVDIRYNSPQEILRVQIPLLATLQTKRNYLTAVSGVKEVSKSDQFGDTLRTTAREEDLPEKTFPEERVPSSPRKEEKRPRILIYHTHTSESYIPVSGQEHIFNGKGDIVKVGQHLSKILNEKYGVTTLHTDKIHDQYPFRESYQRSEKTIKEYLNRHPELEVLIDLHRDATPGIEHRIKIKGKDAAKLIIVVGSDKMGLSHQNWEKNHQFAQELVETIDRFYPGLVHGIILSDARYNQHLHEKSIIIEVGDHNSTLNEILYSAELLAEILASYLKSSSFQSYSL